MDTRPQNPSNQYKVVQPQPPKIEAFTPEWALFRFLDAWTSEDMEIAVRKNVSVDLSSAMGYIEDSVATEILKKFEIQRPDLHKVLATESGKSWLKTQIRQALTQR